MAQENAAVAARVGSGQQGQIIGTAGTTVPPDLNAPLINEPAQASPSIRPVGPLTHLIGTWTNRDIGNSGRGGPENPFSYNLMTLSQAPDAAPGDPQASPYGYILKSMSYYEEIAFTHIHGAAANRGGTGAQISNALLYKQRIYISDGPAKDSVVHFENGIRGFLEPMAQALGPYGDGNWPDVGTPTLGSALPALPYNTFKQISVPHGNSVLACGSPSLTAADGDRYDLGSAPCRAPPPARLLRAGLNPSIAGPRDAKGTV